MHVLNSNSDFGTYLLFTLSGSTYEIFITRTEASLKRFPKNNTGRVLRRDSKAIRIINHFNIVVGRPVEFTLEPLDPNAKFTTRITTRVLEIKRKEDLK